MGKRRQSSRKASTNAADEGQRPKTPARRPSKPSVDEGARDAQNICSPQLRALSGGTELWTMSDMMDAEPIPLPELKDVPEWQFESESAEAKGGCSDPGGRPSLDRTTGSLTPQASTGGYDYPGPYSRHDVFDRNYEHYPYACVGKIFFREGTRRFVGSAFSVGNNAVFTAGHCVHPGSGNANAWYSNFTFVPAYSVDENGEPVTPFGQWPASRLMARQRWIDQGNPNGFTEDMGGAILRKQGGCRSASKWDF